VNYEIRNARAEDAERIVELIADLGHAMARHTVRERIEELHRSDCRQLVAAASDRVIGLCGLHIMTAIHRPWRVGRITILEVEAGFRGQGVGSALVKHAEDRFREAGCGMIELTSNERLVEAHGFYRRIGFDHTSKRFAKQL
jgi:GNAT superfamily N-acetyltransferase